MCGDNGIKMVLINIICKRISKPRICIVNGGFPGKFPYQLTKLIECAEAGRKNGDELHISSADQCGGMLSPEAHQIQNLGFVVIDEQHRFGVEQRARLWTKNEQPPHILVMTATPIPRTLAMTLYGDLDVSVIDELPPGRRPIKTVHYTDAARLRLFGFMKQEIAKGRQVYVVYPLIKESEAMDYKDLTDGYEAISRDFPLPEYVTTICHGKMKPADKEESMRQFKSGEADIMVATSVIEVGVDVPNATVMVIESAERFGLSQLHQLRGRVGRSNQKAYCYLLSPPEEMLSSDARRRLRAIEEFSDLGSGFNIAMQDLDIRGAGNLLGAEQSGFIADIGFETYQKIMNEAIAELRAEGLQVAGLGAAEQDVVEQMHYVDDAHIEIEVEAGLPDAYVAQQAERLKLYRELDSTKDEAALQAFESRLADRFGPLPREAQELLNVVRLRWEAIRLGIERVKVKNGLMILHFVGEQNSPYYKSDTFMELLRKVTQNPARFVLKQHNNRLAMTVRNVKDIEDGYKTLQQL